jgi:hypothetical protein
VSQYLPGEQSALNKSSMVCTGFGHATLPV